jgi:hypothetical protein
MDVMKAHLGGVIGAFFGGGGEMVQRRASLF